MRIRTYVRILFKELTLKVDLLIEIRVFKVNVSNPWWILMRLWIVRSILICTCREALEFHDVLCECASLITENIVDHA